MRKKNNWYSYTYFLLPVFILGFFSVAFFAHAAAPSISSVTPSTVMDQTPVTFNITGSNFVCANGPIPAVNGSFSYSGYTCNSSASFTVVGSFNQFNTSNFASWVQICDFINGCSNKFPITITPFVAGVFNYSLAASGNITVNQGSSGSNTITATLSSGTTQSVSYSASGLPAGATALFSPTSCNPTCSTTLTITASVSTPTGNSTITVTGSPLSKTTTFTLTVNVPPTPPNLTNYAWAGSGTAIDDPGIGWVSFNCANTGVCASSNYGVAVNADGTMSGYAWANPNDGTQNHIGWINFAPAGPYPVSSFVPSQAVRLDRAAGTVRGWARMVNFDTAGGWDGWIGFGSGGNYGSGVTASVCNWSGYAWGGGTVIGWIHFRGTGYGVSGSGNGCALPSFDYSLSNSGNITVNAGASGSNTITSILVLGTTQGVTLSASGLPAGATASFTNNPCSPNCTSQLTITTSLSTPGGTFPVAVTGNPVGRTTSFNLIVNAAPPPPASVSATAATGANACKIINVSWNSSIGATGYNVGRCVGAGCDQTFPSWTPLGSMVSGTSFQDTTASDGVTYRYGVAACFSALLCSVPSYSGTAVNNAPEVTFTYTPSSNIVINQVINFVGNLVGGVVPTSWSWTFAGGNPATANTQNSSSSFSTAGSHAVQLTATNANGSCVVLQPVSVSAGTGGDWCELPPDAPPGTPCP